LRREIFLYAYSVLFAFLGHFRLLFYCSVNISLCFQPVVRDGAVMKDLLLLLLLLILLLLLLLQPLELRYFHIHLGQSLMT
jgi:hypothetical protein